MLVLVFATTQCVMPPSSFGDPNMGGPSVEQREAVIAQEPEGDFFYGADLFRVGGIPACISGNAGVAGGSHQGIVKTVHLGLGQPVGGILDFIALDAG